MRVIDHNVVLTTCKHAAAIQETVVSFLQNKWSTSVPKLWQYISHTLLRTENLAENFETMSFALDCHVEM